jgi:general secretion pathway protein J
MNREHGFTLIELLIAMAILGLISLSMIASLRFGALAWQRSDSQGAAVEQIELAESVLRGLLSTTYPYLSSADPTNVHVLFEGEASRIDFLAPAPAALGGAGLAWFSIASEPEDHGVRVVVSARPELATESFKTWPPSILAKGLATVGIAYFGQDAPDTAPSWHESWSGQRSLPSAIRISATYPAGDGRHWPDLVIVPRIAVDEGCVIDLLSHRCQGR